MCHVPITPMLLNRSRLPFQVINSGFGLPRPMDDHVLLEMSDHQLLLIGGDSGKASTSIYTFDFTNGFQINGDLLTPRQGHVGVLVPRHYARCLVKKNRRMWEKSDSKSSSSSSSSGSSSDSRSRSSSSSSSSSESGSSHSKRHHH